MQQFSNKKISTTLLIYYTGTLYIYTLFYILLLLLCVWVLWEKSYGLRVSKRNNIINEKKKYTIDFRERTRVESFEYGHESRSSSQPNR